MAVEIWVEKIDGIIMTRMRGLPTEAINRELQNRILQLLDADGSGLVLYDIREVEIPPIEAPISQWKIDKESGPLNLKRAVVVPNEKLAYLAGISFANQDFRVFYHDIGSAISWLKGNS